MGDAGHPVRRRRRLPAAQDRPLRPVGRLQRERADLRPQGKRDRRRRALASRRPLCPCRRQGPHPRRGQGDLGARVTTVFPKQGHYALQEPPRDGASVDLAIDRIGDLLNHDLSNCCGSEAVFSVRSRFLDGLFALDRADLGLSAFHFARNTLGHAVNADCARRTGRRVRALPPRRDWTNFGSPVSEEEAARGQKTRGRKGPSMDYQRRFEEAIERLKAEERYRTFANLERDAAPLPHGAVAPGGRGERAARSHRLVLERLSRHGRPSRRDRGLRQRGARPWRRGRRHPQHFRHPSSDRRARGASSPTCTASRRRSSSPPAGSPTSPAISTIASLLPDCLILSDALNHNSMIEGVKRSGCEKKVWRHNDVAHLEALLAAEPIERAKLIVFESLYSMDGDIAPIAEIVALAEKYDAMTYIDEVHAVGIYGPRGGGLARARGPAGRDRRHRGHARQGFRLARRLYRGERGDVDAVRSYAPQFIFTSTLPPSVAAERRRRRAASQALERRARAPSAYGAARQACAARRRPAGDRQSLAHRAGVGARRRKCRAASEMLLERHAIYIQPINYPTVAKGTERLRITPTPRHNEAQVAALVEALVDVWRRSACRSRRPQVVPLRRAGAEAAAMRLSGDEAARRNRRAGLPGRPSPDALRAAGVVEGRNPVARRRYAGAECFDAALLARLGRDGDVAGPAHSAAPGLHDGRRKPLLAALAGERQAPPADLADAAGGALSARISRLRAPRRASFLDFCYTPDTRRRGDAAADPPVRLRRGDPVLRHSRRARRARPAGRASRAATARASTRSNARPICARSRETPTGRGSRRCSRRSTG